MEFDRGLRDKVGHLVSDLVPEPACIRAPLTVPDAVVAVVVSREAAPGQVGDVQDSVIGKSRPAEANITYGTCKWKSKFTSRPHIASRAEQMVNSGSSNFLDVE